MRAKGIVCLCNVLNLQPCCVSSGVDYFEPEAAAEGSVVEPGFVFETLSQGEQCEPVRTQEIWEDRVKDIGTMTHHTQLH